MTAKADWYKLRADGYHAFAAKTPRTLEFLFSFRHQHPQADAFGSEIDYLLDIGVLFEVSSPVEVVFDPDYSDEGILTIRRPNGELAYMFGDAFGAFIRK